MSHARLHKEYHITWILRKTHLKQHLTKHWINSWEFYNDRNLTLSTRGQGSSVWKTKIWITRRCITSFFQEVAQQGKGKKKKENTAENSFLYWFKKKKKSKADKHAQILMHIFLKNYTCSLVLKNLLVSNAYKPFISVGQNFSR